MAPPVRDIPAPARRYHLLELAGRGAYGDVYLAELDSGGTFRRKVALKVLNENASRLKSARERIQAEARILGRLAHRHIVAALDFVRLDNRWAIVMDYVPGADLEHIVAALELRGDRFPGPAAFEVGAAIADALHAAYSAVADDGRQLGIVHRDIKPSNVRLTPDGEVKVLDFGVARGADEPEARGTGVVGTETYMAPERLIGTADLPAGDVYSTAATVVELILGRPLGRTPVLPEVHQEFVNEALYAVHNRLEGPPAVVKAAVELLRRGLAARDGERPTAAQLSEGLESAARSLSGETLRPFCKRFVPGIDDVLGRMRIPVDEVLGETTHLVELAPGGTIVPPPDGPTGEGPTPVPETRQSGRILRFVGSLALTALLSSTCGGLAVYGVSSLVLAAAEPAPAVPLREASLAEASPPPIPFAKAPEPPPSAAATTTIAPPSSSFAVAVVPEETTPRRPRPESQPLIPQAKFILKDAQKIDVRCGSRFGSSSTNVLMKDVEPGRCTVSVVVNGRTISGSVLLESEGVFTCRVNGDEIQCSR